MDETEIRLHCVEVAEGDLHRAKQIYNWVMNKDEPRAGGVVHPIQSVVGLNVGIPVSSGSATTRA